MTGYGIEPAGLETASLGAKDITDRKRSDGSQANNKKEGS